MYRNDLIKECLEEIFPKPNLIFDTYKVIDSIFFDSIEPLDGIEEIYVKSIKFDDGKYRRVYEEIKLILDETENDYFYFDSIDNNTQKELKKFIEMFENINSHKTHITKYYVYDVINIYQETIEILKKKANDSKWVTLKGNLETLIKQFRNQHFFYFFWNPNSWKKMKEVINVVENVCDRTIPLNIVYEKKMKLIKKNITEIMTKNNVNDYPQNKLKDQIDNEIEFYRLQVEHLQKSIKDVQPIFERFWNKETSVTMPILHTLHKQLFCNVQFDSIFFANKKILKDYESSLESKNYFKLNGLEQFISLNSYYK